MIATLPMYDWPEIRPATDAFWRAISSRLEVELPLDRTLSYEDSWRRPDLLFSQTCGYPFTHGFRGILSYVATPHYGVPGCRGADYSSSIFLRSGCTARDRQLRAAINSMDSMSGMLALKLSGPAFGETVISGSHIRSLEMLQNKQADVCAVDAVCVELARRHRPWLLEGLAEIGRSPFVPSLPYVTRSADAEDLRKVLADVFLDKSLADIRQALLLQGIHNSGAASYERIVELEAGLPQ